MLTALVTSHMLCLPSVWALCSYWSISFNIPCFRIADFSTSAHVHSVTSEWSISGLTIISKNFHVKVKWPKAQGALEILSDNKNKGQLFFKKTFKNAFELWHSEIVPFIFLFMASKLMEDVHLAQKTFHSLPSNFPLADVESSRNILEVNGIKTAAPTRSWPEARWGCWNKLQGSKSQPVLYTLSVFPFALKHIISSLQMRSIKAPGPGNITQDYNSTALEGGSYSFR